MSSRAECRTSLGAGTRPGPDRPARNGQGLRIISNSRADRGNPGESGIALLFDADQRPCAADVEKLVEAGSLPVLPFTISHAPDPGEGWLELLAMGLAFDLAGLAPAAGMAMPEIPHHFGVAPDFAREPLAVATLLPGSHLSGAANMVPVVRAQVGIAAGLATLPGLRAIAWGPARAAIRPDAFVRMGASWLDGGAFPALGLTALVADPDGSVRSEGLAFFTGQEIQVAPLSGGDPREAARIAVRLIDSLVGADPVTVPTRFTGPAGEPLLAEPTGDHRLLRIKPEG